MARAKTTPQRAADIADRCQDAYSYEAFGQKEWRAAAQMLADRGYTEREIEAVLRSKWTRWSRDAEGTYEGTAKGLALLLDSQKNFRSEVRALVAGTFFDAK